AAHRYVGLAGRTLRHHHHSGRTCLPRRWFRPVSQPALSAGMLGSGVHPAPPGHAPRRRAGGMSIRLAALLMALSLPIAASGSADTTGGDEPAHPVSPHECERWQAHIGQLRESDDALERQLGELHARPDLAYCQEKQVRTSRFDFDFDWEPGSLPDFGGLALVVKWLVILGLGALGLWLILRLRKLPAFQRAPADAAKEPPQPRFLAEA